MASLNLTVKHGQPWDVARANFVKGIESAQATYGRHFNPVEWSDDRTSATLSGTGFRVHLSVDLEAVSATGDVPFFVRMMEGQIRRFIEEALRSPP